MKKITADISELNQVVKAIKESNKSIILLRGNLASGKTTLVKAFVESLGIDENVTSPTFSIQQVYDDKVFHYDIYNKELETFLELGLFEEFEKDGFHLVEWGDERLEAILENYGFEYLTVDIESFEDKRIYTILI